MHSVSSTYNQIVAQESHKFETRVTIANVEYVQKREGRKGTLRSVITRGHTFGTNTIQFGKADSREIELEIFGNSSRIPRNAKIDVSVRAMTEDESSVSEWIPKGTFYIDTRSSDSQLINDDEVISIVGMDVMMRGEKLFDTFPNAWLQEGKTTAIAAMEYAARALRVTVDDRTYTIMNQRDFEIPLPTQYTIRETLGNIAALYGGSFIINDFGYLQLICPWRNTSVYDLGMNAQGLQVYPQYDECVGVRMLISEKGYKVKKPKNDGSGEDEEIDCYVGGFESGGYVFEIECPWATQAQADWLYSKMSGYVYTPFQAEAGEVDPKVEIGDYVTVRSKDGKSATGGLFTQEITFGKYLTCDFGAPGEEEIDHEYQCESSADRKYTRRLYNAEATLAIHQDEILARVTKTGGEEGDSDFWWQLLDDRFRVGSGDKEIFRVDRTGGFFDGDGNFTGKLSSAEIYIPSEEDWNFMVDSSGNMYARGADISGIIRADGGIYVGDQSVATSDQLAQIMSDLRSAMTLQGGSYSGGTGLLNSLQAANNYNKAISRDSESYPDYFYAQTIVAGTHGFYSSKYYVNTGDDSTEFDLAKHEHNLSASENGDKIEISCGKPVASGVKASFSIADTKKYKDMVSALTVKSITFEKTAKETFYEIKATAKNAAGEDLLTRTDNTDSTVWRNGYNDAQDRYEPKSVDFDISESSTGMYYEVSVTVSNGSGTELLKRSSNSDTTVYFNGYRAAEAEHANDYQNGQSDTWNSISAWLEASYQGVDDWSGLTYYYVYPKYQGYVNGSWVEGSGDGGYYYA